MKKFSDILKGITVGSLAGLIALIAIHSVSASSDISGKLAIPALPSKPLTINSSVDEVLALMLESDQKWNSLIAAYQLSTRDLVTNEINVQNQYFWLDKKGEWARVETDGPDSVLFVRNAATIAYEKRNQKVYFQVQTPSTFKYDGFNPRDLVTNGGGAVYLHPYGKVLPTGYYDFIYPTGIAQSMILNQAKGKENLQILGEDEVVGRKTIILSRMSRNHLLWVDVETGVVLRVQYVGEADTWQVQFEAISIEYDVRVDGSIFQFAPSKGAKKITSTEFFKTSLDNQ
ncbi:MAG: hypothetical protein LC108_06590 [Anaerolineales bacterium]|nr:hypothetical protein [Anaerolineales bacterium]